MTSPEIRDPVRYDRDSLDVCLRTLVAEGASDVLLVSESPVRAYLRGRWETVGTRALKTHELADVLNAIDMGNASSMVASGQARNIFNWGVLGVIIPFVGIWGIDRILGLFGLS